MDLTTAKVLMGAAGASEKTYVDDVFSTYIYTGNGSSQTITNDINLLEKGGLVWIKANTNGVPHTLSDTSRGALKSLSSDSANAEITTETLLTSFNADGFSVSSDLSVNENARTIASWTFRKATKFFDVLTYTGDGAGPRTLNHMLGITPGMIVTKATSTAGAWLVYHQAAGFGVGGILNGTDAFSSLNANVSAANSTNYTTLANDNGVAYVVYLFAHDTDSDGLIQCGSFSGGATVTLGWEPQYLLYKSFDGADDWKIVDAINGIPSSTIATSGYLANTTAPRSTIANLALFSDGFVHAGEATLNYIYIAIRRSNKPADFANKVFGALTYTGNSTIARRLVLPITYDLFLVANRFAAVSKFALLTRILGTVNLISSSNAAQSTSSAVFRDSNLLTNFTATLGTGQLVNASANDYIGYVFKRAVGFFDVVTYTGNELANRNVSHKLGTQPEMFFLKARSDVSDWSVYVKVGNSYSLGYLNLTSTVNDTGLVKATSTTFAADLNADGITYVAYLFGSRPGISKVGSYVGNGSSQTINCGFTTGARFVLIKRADSSGDWYVWDTARGIVSGNDPYLSVNTTAIEVATDDSVDPDTSGFVVNQLAETNINVSSASYIFFAVA